MSFSLLWPEGDPLRAQNSAPGMGTIARRWLQTGQAQGLSEIMRDKQIHPLYSFQDWDGATLQVLAQPFRLDPGQPISC
jgi:hypothetical protein